MADNASLDQNRNKTLQAVSTVNNSSTVNLQADPITHALKVSSSNQTDGSQLTQIVDLTGNSVTVTGNKLDTNSLIGNTLITVPFDYIGAGYPDTSTEVYTYKTGGSGGTTVGTITVVYSDAVTKQIITSVTKT